ncbi:MAG: glycosyltransferase family 4 protein [Gemmatimonadota bacterium]
MKALLLTQDFLPGQPGGIAIYYYNLCRRLEGAVSVLTTRCPDSSVFDGEQSFPIHRRRIPISPLSLSKQTAVSFMRWPRVGYVAASQWLQFYRHGSRLAVEECADVVLIGHLYLAPLGVHLRRKTGVRYGVILHGGELHRYMRVGAIKRSMLNALNSADFLIVNSDFTRDQYHERGVRRDQRFLKVSPGVDTSVFRPDAGDPESVRRKYELGDRPLVLSVARLVEWKGQDTMLRALPEVLAEVPDALYLIVGGGPYRPDLERLARQLGVYDHVVFTGFVHESELPSYYRAADVLAVPSREVTKDVPIEGFGIVYVEAGACGTPSIGGRGGGTNESIDDGVTGLRVDSDSPSEVAGATIQLLKDREMAQRFGRAGREFAVSNYDWSIQAKRLGGFLADLASGR